MFRLTTRGVPPAIVALVCTLTLAMSPAMVGAEEGPKTTADWDGGTTWGLIGVGALSALAGGAAGGAIGFGLGKATCKEDPDADTGGFLSDCFGTLFGFGFIYTFHKRNL